MSSYLTKLFMISSDRTRSCQGVGRASFWRHVGLRSLLPSCSLSPSGARSRLWRRCCVCCLVRTLSKGVGLVCKCISGLFHLRQNFSRIQTCCSLWQFLAWRRVVGNGSRQSLVWANGQTKYISTDRPFAEDCFPTKTNISSDLPNETFEKPI